MFGQATGSATGPFVRSRATLPGYSPERVTHREESKGDWKEGESSGVPPGVWTQYLISIPALVLPKTALAKDPAKGYSLWHWSLSWGDPSSCNGDSAPDFRLMLRFIFLTQLHGTRWLCEMEASYIRQKSWPNDLHNVSLIPMTSQC